MTTPSSLIILALGLLKPTHSPSPSSCWWPYSFPIYTNSDVFHTSDFPLVSVCLTLWLFLLAGRLFISCYHFSLYLAMLFGILFLSPTIFSFFTTIVSLILSARLHWRMILTYSCTITSPLTSSWGSYPEHSYPICYHALPSILMYVLAPSLQIQWGLSYLLLHCLLAGLVI